MSVDSTNRYTRWMDVSDQIKIHEILDFEVREDVESLTILVYLEGNESTQYEYFVDVNLLKYTLPGSSTSGMLEIELTPRNKSSPAGSLAV